MRFHFAPINKIFSLNSINNKYYLVFVLCMSFIVSAFSQTKEDFPQNYFRSPVDVKIYLSGTFGEPRSTHYHTGLDIKTQGVEGKKLYAVADGYVSRIKISPYGYGNALYITHPNGYTSVYAHMSAFNDTIKEYAKRLQIAETSFEIDMDSLPKDHLIVFKSDVIGLSGNSGGSGGPHLHFEIRDSLERPINPLLFGFDAMVDDNARPEIYNLLFYNETEDRHLTSSKMIKPTDLGGGNYKISTTVKVNRNEVGIGVHSVDKFTGISNKNGVYEIELYFDEELVYHYQMSRISFDHTKHVFSQCDFWRKRYNKQTVYKCFKEQGNLLTAHPYLFNNGMLYLYDNDQHAVRVVVKDFHGNAASAVFNLQLDEEQNFFVAKEDKHVDIFPYSIRNTFVRDGFEIDIPKESLFDDVYFNYRVDLKTSSPSDGHQIHEHSTPIAKYYKLKIRPNDIDSGKIDKYLIARTDYKGRTKTLDNTRYVKNHFTAESRDFGYHFVAIDTVQPKITPSNFYNKKKVTYQKTLTLKATDNLSGIKEYNAFVNGEWVILEYDAKRALFTYVIDEHMKVGENNFEVIISDERSNATIYSATLVF